MLTFIENILEIAIGVLLADYVVSGKAAKQVVHWRDGAQTVAAHVKSAVTNPNEASG